MEPDESGLEAAPAGTDAVGNEALGLLAGLSPAEDAGLTAPARPAPTTQFRGILPDRAGKARGPVATLSQALAQARATNATLNAARAEVRAFGEAVPQARAAMLPNFAGSAEYGNSRTLAWDDLEEADRSHTLSLGLTAKQAVFDGFQASNNVAGARAEVRGATESLVKLEQDILLRTVTAYEDVLRDRAVSGLRRDNVAFLDRQLKSTKVLFGLGEATNTDVAQTESQLALATALLNTAAASLAGSEAAYLETVGTAPARLDRIGVPAGLPPSLRAALETAMSEHPSVRAARFNARGAESRVNAAKGALLPAVDVTGSLGYDPSWGNSAGTDSLPGVGLGTRRETMQATVGVQLSVPLYQGGLTTSRIRQAAEVLGQRQIQVDEVRRQVRTAVSTAWAQFGAAQANVTGYAARVRAAQTALSGVETERQVGQRTTYDVLTAQAEVVSSQILLVGAQRDEIVSAYTLLAAVGDLGTDAGPR